MPLNMIPRAMVRWSWRAMISLGGVALYWLWVPGGVRFFLSARGITSLIAVLWTLTIAVGIFWITKDSHENDDRTEHH